MRSSAPRRGRPGAGCAALRDHADPQGTALRDDRRGGRSALAHGGIDADLIRRTGLGSLIVAPCVARDRVLGVTMFGRSRERAALTEEDLKTALELAARTAMCLDNALVYHNERRIAVALQRSMLPEEGVLPQLPGLEIAHLYQPSSHAAQVGGDWFDVIALSGHRVAFVVGDVMGHDIQAAANMGQLRTAMRTLARLDLEPVDLFTHLDDTVQNGTTIQYATCVYAVCNTVTRRVQHRQRRPSPTPPAPRGRHHRHRPGGLRRAPGRGHRGPAVRGHGPDPARGRHAGAVHRRTDRTPRRGPGHRHRVPPDRPGTPRRVSPELCERVAAAMGCGVAEDDLAMLMARVPSDSDHAHARWTLASHPESVCQARRSYATPCAHGTCTTWRTPPSSWSANSSPTPSATPKATSSYSWPRAACWSARSPTATSTSLDDAAPAPTKRAAAD